ncbi:FecR family protein [Flavobacterium sp. IMCC34518]|uniref:FecR family protein n=1 Tax=Flavobacterium sp. IMCC34518 TaxID=3003623 RepID=UPI0022AC4346|nr:FecR family protein [Flavobacterium sp. IMCC34518]
MYQKEVFKELMYQFVSGEISLEGKAQLLKMIDDPQYADDLDFILRENYERIGPVKANPESTQQFIQSLTKKINTINDLVAEEADSTLFNWKKLLVAASIVLVMGLGYVAFNRNKVSTAIANIDKNVIMPGRSGAILTLGDGSQIVLDSVANGVLANQSNTAVAKKDGEIIYTEGSNARGVINKMMTPRGRQFKLELSDGTKVWLNASSSISFPTAFAANERKVSIVGEVYFEVTKDKHRPFKVTVNDVEVQVLGTHFNVNGYDDEGEIKTSLIEGSVLVGKKDQKVLLKPGQQANIKKSGGVKVKALDNFDEVLAWKNGMFHFDNASLETVLRQISRWYDVDVVMDKGVVSRNFEGEINRDLELSQVLKILEGNNVHFKIEGKILKVIP